MRTLTVKMEEFESTAVQSSRVTIKKMEQRIEELEVGNTFFRNWIWESKLLVNKKKKREISYLFFEAM